MIEQIAMKAHLLQRHEDIGRTFAVCGGFACRMRNDQERCRDFLPCDTRRCRWFVSRCCCTSELCFGAARRTKNGWNDRGNVIGCHSAWSACFIATGDFIATAQLGAPSPGQSKLVANNSAGHSQPDDTGKYKTIVT
jgi:hypothetical protein